MSENSKIQVVIRKRPLNSKERQTNQEDIIEVVSNDTLHIREKKQKVDLTKFTEKHEFIFDNVFDESQDNDQIYETVLSPQIQRVFGGTKVTCFAYGQTGSGKTFTMMGDLRRDIDGLYQMATRDIY